MLTLRPFQRRAVRAFESGRYDTVVLSVPRGQGKSTLAAWLAWRALQPDDPMFRPGTESHLVASTVGQARRTCFRILRRMIEEVDPGKARYSIAESLNQCHVVHRKTNTRVSVVAGSAKSTLGLVGCPLAVVDEPGSYELDAGAGLWDALTTAQGKPDSPLRLFVIGHLAPRATRRGHWYYDLVHAGTTGRTYVQFLQARPDRWSKASEIRRVSPLSWSFPASRAKLLEQRDAALLDSAARARFLSFRANLPTADQASVLLPVESWALTLARAVPDAAGRPVVGVDLGQSRAWSAAVAIWPSGRVEAVAVSPGIPTLAEQEKRDGVNPGEYQRLVDQGRLFVAEGRRVPSAAVVAGLALAWLPRVIVCDFFRRPELADHVKCRIVTRRNRWSDGTADIRGLRRMAADGPLSVDPESRSLLEASLSVARVETDDAGSTRLIKRGHNNQARDDVSAALVLAAGVASRIKPRSSVAVAVPAA